jgi:hypothetical protein
MSNLSLVLSGGASNINPNLSLGGDPSSTKVNDNIINNLFGDVSQDSTIAAASEDYRCVYVFNDVGYPLEDVKIWMFYDIPEGADVLLGTTQQNEVQRISIQGTIDSGFFTLSYDGDILPNVNYNSNLDDFAAELQTSLLNMFYSVVVTHNVVSNTTIFDVEFTEKSGKRSYDLLSVYQNNLSPQADISVSRIYAGYPINTIAPAISSANVTPANVPFYVPSSQSPISLPRLEVGDGFPLWIERSVPINATPKELDGFTMRITAQVMEPTQ